MTTEFEMTPQTLSFDGFQHACGRTWNVSMIHRDRITNAVMGLAGEVGEVVEPIKKNLFHGKPAPTADQMSKELGDVLYYVAVLAAEYGLSLQSIAEGNVAKLMARYPNGFPTRTVDGVL